MNSALYLGTLVHSRREPVHHRFRYRLASFLIDLDELPELERRLTALAVNRRNLVSINDRDHFDGQPLKEAVLALTADPTIERVLMLTQPRVLGYVFNPVSFYWCYRADGSLACMVAELNNTFGERLAQVLHGPQRSYTKEKQLHVSPFFGLDQSYEYAFSEPGSELWARIHVREGSRRPLTAVLHGRRVELSNAALARMLVGYPLQPARIIAQIHWQALRLWLRRVPFHHKPPFGAGEGSARV